LKTLCFQGFLFARECRNKLRQIKHTGNFPAFLCNVFLIRSDSRKRGRNVHNSDGKLMERL